MDADLPFSTGFSAVFRGATGARLYVSPRSIRRPDYKVVKMSR
jgi:hypothetical protein